MKEILLNDIIPAIPKAYKAVNALSAFGMYVAKLSLSHPNLFLPRLHPGWLGIYATTSTFESVWERT